MYLYHFTQITLKIQPVFKLLAKASHNSEEGNCSHPIDASSGWLDSSNCTNSPHKMTFLYRYPLRTLFEVLKNPFRRSNLHKNPRTIKDFSALNPAKYRSFRAFVDRSKDFWRRQPDGDDHWPVTVTSKKRISAVPVGWGRTLCIVVEFGLWLLFMSATVELDFFIFSYL